MSNREVEEDQEATERNGAEAGKANGEIRGADSSDSKGRVEDGDEGRVPGARHGHAHKVDAVSGVGVDELDLLGPEALGEVEQIVACWIEKNTQKDVSDDSGLRE